MSITLRFDGQFRWSLDGEPFLVAKSFGHLYANVTVFNDGTVANLALKDCIVTYDNIGKSQNKKLYFTHLGLGTVLNNTFITLQYGRDTMVRTIKEYKGHSLVFGYNHTNRTLIMCDYSTFLQGQLWHNESSVIWGSIQFVNIVCIPLTITLPLFEVSKK